MKPYIHRELRILDNKLNESEWDMELLKQELDELDFSEFDIDFEIALEEAEADYMPEPMEDFRECGNAGEETKGGLSPYFFLAGIINPRCESLAREGSRMKQGLYILVNWTYQDRQLLR